MLDVNKLVADGRIDAAEADQIRAEIFADGEVDRAEADALFEINDAVSGADNDPKWQGVFVDGIKTHILTDGEVDDEETAYLIDKIGSDGEVDENERALLQAIYDAADAVTPQFAQYCAENGVVV